MQQELYEIEQRIRHEPPPAIDLKLKLKSHSKSANSPNSSAVLQVQPAEAQSADLYNMSRQRKSEKVSLPHKSPPLAIAIGDCLLGLPELLEELVSHAQGAA